MVKFGIGQSIRRVEDPRLLTGGGRYTDDTKLAGKSARGYVLRSPHAHATVRGIDTAAARKAPGVLAVLTYADVKAAGFGDLPCLVPLDNRDGTPRGDTQRPMLANGRVRHVGDPVAFVVAETRALAQDAAEQVQAARVASQLGHPEDAEQSQRSHRAQVDADDRHEQGKNGEKVDDRHGRDHEPQAADDRPLVRG